MITLEGVPSTQSRINSNIRYTENKKVEKKDRGRSVPTFLKSIKPLKKIGFTEKRNDTLKIKEKLKLNIAIGNKRTIENIAYFPIYIVIDPASQRFVQIGVYEFLASKLSNYLHRRTNQLRVSHPHFPKPLYYSFVTETFLNKMQGLVKKRLSKSASSSSSSSSHKIDMDVDMDVKDDDSDEEQDKEEEENKKGTDENTLLKKHKKKKSTNAQANPSMQHVRIVNQYVHKDSHSGPKRTIKWNRNPFRRKTMKRKRKQGGDIATRIAHEDDVDENMGHSLSGGGSKQDSSKDKENTTGTIMIPSYRNDIFTAIEGVVIPYSRNKEETKEQAKAYVKEYADRPQNVWIQKCFRNNNYHIVAAEGGSDCIFATVRDAFGQIAQQTTVTKLRQKIANEVTTTVFNDFRDRYDFFREEISMLVAKIKEMETKYKTNQTHFNETTDLETKRQLMAVSKIIARNRLILLQRRKIASLLFQDIKFMQKLDSLEKLKTKMQSCELYGNAWMLSTLERILNIKFIVLNYDAYKRKDVAHILHCDYEFCDENKDNVSFFKHRKKFDPDYYIIVEKFNHDYKLVSYKQKQIFLFHEIPFDLRVLIGEKCIESKFSAQQSLFSLINDFGTFQNQMISNLKKTSTQDKEKQDTDELSESSIRNLFDDNVVLQFHQHASEDEIPGKGVGEKMDYQTMLSFSTLQSIKEWRRKLDDTWLDIAQPYLIDGHYWNSVYHFLQASKFKKTNPTYFMLFTAESSTPLSKTIAMAKAAGSVSGKYKGKRIRPQDIKLDERTSLQFHDKLLPRAYEAKFTQTDEMQFLLLETKNAKLMQYRKGKPPILSNHLMILRESLRQKKVMKKTMSEWDDKALESLGIKPKDLKKGASPTQLKDSLLQVYMKEQFKKDKEKNEGLVRKMLHF